jgi:hypothetical protein
MMATARKTPCCSMNDYRRRPPSPWFCLCCRHKKSPFLSPCIASGLRRIKADHRDAIRFFSSLCNVPRLRTSLSMNASNVVLMSSVFKEFIAADFQRNSSGGEIGPTLKQRCAHGPRSGRFNSTDKLIASLRPQTFMRRQ